MEIIITYDVDAATPEIFEDEFSRAWHIAEANYDDFTLRPDAPNGSALIFKMKKEGYFPLIREGDRISCCFGGSCIVIYSCYDIDLELLEITIKHE